MLKAYEGLHTQVRKIVDQEIKRYLRQSPSTTGQSILGVLTDSDRDLGEIINSLSSVFGRKSDVDRITNIVEDISEQLSYAVQKRIVSGFEVTAEDPPSSKVSVSLGKGVSGAGYCETESAQTLEIPLWDSGQSVWYITIEPLAGLSIDTSETDERLTIAKIIVPKPGTTAAIQDDKPTDGWNGYIINLRTYDWHYYNNVLEDDAREFLRDNMGKIMTSSIFGTLNLSENLKIANTAGSLEMDSKEVRILFENGNVAARFNREGVYFFDENGNEFAHYAKNEARVGNILIKRNSLESGNFVEGLAGFRIKDDGSVEFEDATIRGTINALSGTIGGWTIEANRLVSSGTPYVSIDGTNQRIETSNFASGLLGTGWRIDNLGAEFQNITARGLIRSSVFEYNTVSGMGGLFIVSPASNLADDMTADDNATLTVDRAVFSLNETLLIKDGTDDESLLVTGISAAPTYVVTRDIGGNYAINSNPAWKKGTAVVSTGIGSGDKTGFITLDTISGDLPFIDILYRDSTSYLDYAVKARLGNLDGIAGASGAGLFSSNVFLTGNINANSGYLGNLTVDGLLTLGSSGFIRTQTIYPYLELSQDGLQFKSMDPGGTYGNAEYGTDKYGYGATGWIFNEGIGVPIAFLKEPIKSGASSYSTMAELRFVNRSLDPTGSSEIGDICVSGARMRICATAGTPGAFTSNLTNLDIVSSLADINSPGADIEDAVDKKHSRNTDIKIIDGDGDSYETVEKTSDCDEATTYLKDVLVRHFHDDGILDLPKQSRCRAYLGTNQDVVNNDWVKIELDTEDYDNQDEFDSDTDYEFTAKTEGYYQVNASLAVQEAMGAGDRLSVAIYKNGGAIASGGTTYATDIDVPVNVSDITYLAVGDTLSLYVRQEFTENRFINGVSAYTFMSIHKLS